MDEFQVTFKPQNLKVRAAKGMDLLTAAFKAGIVINASCGGEGVCGKCKVMVGDKKEAVLACATIVESDLEVTVPPESIGSFEVGGKRLKDTEEYSKGIALKEENLFKHLPLVRKVNLKLPEPTLDDNVSDFERVERSLKGLAGEIFISTKLANVKHLGRILRESDFNVTAILAYKENSIEIISFEPGDTAKRNYGCAFDIGTTTVTGQLIDLNTKEIVATRIAYNRQASFGADVITRIIHASNPAGLKEMNEAVLGNLNEMADELTKAGSIALGDVYSVVLAGNMTMMHLLLKVDPTYIRKEPYVPTSTSFSMINASEIGLRINPRGIAAFLPGVSTYVGGDIVSGVLSTGVYDSEALELLIDIGTNGEIVLGNREWMISCSASAGPSFEGSGLEFGMKAVKGAIQKAAIDENLALRYETIDNERPKGICGSGYIDLLNNMLKRNLIEKNGKINKCIKCGRIRKREDGYEFVVAPKNETAIGRDIVIHENDIENLKRSKGAIYSAIIALVNKVEKNINDVKRIHIAGGFGNYIDMESAISIGLLPDVSREVYEFVGNSSLAGARMALLSHDAYLKSMQIHKNITYLDLSSDPRYMDEYVAALFFPHTDSRRFPSVR